MTVNCDGVYTDAACAVPYVGGPNAAAGTTLFAQVLSPNVQGQRVGDYFRVGHQILMRSDVDPNLDVVCEITNVTTAAGVTTLSILLLENDDNSVALTLGNTDTIKIIGNINSEGAEMPDAVAFNPIEQYNYTQIFRTPLSITRTARLTKLRTESDYQKMKREALEMHGIEMENAFLWGIRTLGTGDNGKPKRTTLGLINWIRANAPQNCDAYHLNAAYATQDWVVAGEEWFDNMLEQIFRYGSSEKLALCGSGALLGLNRLAKAGGQVNLQPTSAEYGLKVIQWITPFGVVNLKTHPLFSYDATTREMMVIFEPKDLTYKYITDTSFYPDKEKDSRNGTRMDATIEEFLTEAGLEFHFAEKCGVLNGVGKDSSFATTAP